MKKGSGHSRDESADTFRQREANEFLREEARRAHTIGDGFLVNHLCAIALKRVVNATTDERLPLGLKETFWALVFSVYWLISEHVLGSVGGILKAFKNTNAEPTDLRKIVEGVAKLVENPLEPIDGITDELLETELQWLDEDCRSEGLAVVSLAVELIWQRDWENKYWIRLVRHWRTKCGDEFKSNLNELHTRLALQAELVFPDRTHSSVRSDDPFWNSGEVPFYRGWKHYLFCEWGELKETLISLVPFVPYDSPRFLALCGLQRLHWNLGESEDPSDITATRWQLKASSGGPSAFREIRRTRFGQWLADFWRKKRGKADLYRLLHGFRLGTLDQIASLREWDAWSWNLATSQLADAHLAFAAKLPEQHSFAVEGLRLAIQSRTFDKDDLELKNRLSALDFVPTDQRASLVKSITQSRPVESFISHQMLEALSDSIPENSLLSVADWCVAYVSTPREGIGWTLNPLSFWAEILPYIKNSLKVCQRLYPAVLKLSGHPAIWETDRGGMLTEFLVRAPFDLAVEVGERMMSLDVRHESANAARWTRIFNAALLRPDPAFSEIFKERLVDTAQSEYEKFHLPLLDNPEMARSELNDTQLHEWCKKKVLHRIEVVMSRKPGDTIGFGGGVGFDPVEKVKWTEEDIQIVRQLIEAIDSAPRIEWFEVQEFLHYCTAMVSAGPQILEDILYEALLRWVELPPSCPDSVADSGVTVLGPTGHDRVVSALAHLAGRIVMRRRGKPEENLIRWVITNSFACPNVAVPDMMFLGAVLGADQPSTAGITVMSTCQLLMLRAWQAPGVAEVDNEALARALRQVAVLVDSTNQWSIYTAESLDSARLFLDSLERVIPNLQAYPNPDVRAAAARVLRLWDEQGSIPPGLKPSLAQFQQDARARVRFETRSHDSN